MSALPDYVTPEYLDALVLCHGTGDGTDGHRCAIQEVRHWLDLDARTDTIPDCVCPVLGRLAIRINDTSVEERRAIVPLLPHLIGTRGDTETTLRRARRCADWAVREVTPHALDGAARALDSAALGTHAATLRDHAGRLRALAPITDDAAYAAAHAAYAAAGYAAAAAARYAAYAAAGYAAAAAARYAADAAAAAARYAAAGGARHAAYAAAGYAAAAAAGYAADDAAARYAADDAPRASDLLRALLDGRGEET